MLALVAALAIVPLYLAAREGGGVTDHVRDGTSVPVLIAAVAVVLWLRLPPDYVLNRSLARPPARASGC